MSKIKEENKALFGFQWHITDRCNLRCTHCYQGNYSGSHELNLDELKKIADDIIDTLSKWNKKGDIAITGGEPLLKDELFPIIDYIEAAKEVASIDILSNGTLINDNVLENIQRCKKLNCVQISLDGASNKTNDVIRGDGAFAKAINGIRLLKANNIVVNIMFTLQRANITEVPSIIDLATSEGADKLTIERCVPIGSGSNNIDQALSAEEIRKVFEYIYTRRKDGVTNISGTSISCTRPLWALCNNNIESVKKSESNNVGGICSIGLDGLCILPDATVLPCRRLPIPIGNLNTESISTIWHKSKLLWEIADKRNLKGKCNSCEQIPYCSGCRAMAYACTGDYLAEDPQCWK